MVCAVTGLAPDDKMIMEAKTIELKFLNMFSLQPKKIPQFRC